MLLWLHRKPANIEIVPSPQRWPDFHALSAGMPVQPFLSILIVTFSVGFVKAKDEEEN